MAVYEYAAEDGAGIDLTAAHEANRTPLTRAAQIYLKTVQLREPPAVLPGLDRRAGRCRFPRTGCSAWSLTTAITPACRRARSRTSRGRCAPTRSPPTGPDSRCAPTGACSGCCSSTTSRRSRRPGPTCLVRSLDLRYSRPADAAGPRQPALHVHRRRLPRPATGRPAKGWSPARCRRSSSTYSQPVISSQILHARPRQPGQPAARTRRCRVPLGGSRRRRAVRDPQRRGKRLVLQAEPQRRQPDHPARRHRGRAGRLRSARGRVRAPVPRRPEPGSAA